MKIGDYVRTDIGEIRKVVKATDYTYVLDKDVVFAHKDKIKKSSPNIIDLIEVGDILTIKDILGNTSKVEVDETFKLLSGKIVSIVTKEQFEAIEYRIGDKE